MRRVDKSLRVYFNEEAAALPESGQRPSFFHFPDIPVSPYLNRERFPWVDSFEAETLDIRRELLSLLPGSDGREPVFGQRRSGSQSSARVGTAADLEWLLLLPSRRTAER